MTNEDYLINFLQKVGVSISAEQREMALRAYAGAKDNEKKYKTNFVKDSKLYFEFTDTERKIWDYFRKACHQTTNLIAISQKQIKNIFGMKPTTARNALKRLCFSGFIAVVGDTPKNKPTKYMINPHYCCSKREPANLQKTFDDLYFDNYNFHWPYKPGTNTYKDPYNFDFDTYGDEIIEVRKINTATAKPDEDYTPFDATTWAFSFLHDDDFFKKVDDEPKQKKKVSKDVGDINEDSLPFD